MARDAIKFDIDITKAAKKLHKLEKKFDEEGVLSTHDIGDWGKNIARTLAPYGSGKVVRNIKLFEGEGGKAIVVAQEPRGNRLWPNSGRYKDFELVRWMHETRGIFRSNNPFGAAGTKHITSGDPQFMFTTAKMMRKKFPSMARRRLNKIIVRENAR